MDLAFMHKDSETKRLAWSSSANLMIGVLEKDKLAQLKSEGHELLGQDLICKAKQ